MAGLSVSGVDANGKIVHTRLCSAPKTSGRFDAAESVFIRAQLPIICNKKSRRRQRQQLQAGIDRPPMTTRRA
ncbi:MAG: hypothetical protein AMJ54_16350 [Deltaproteobacteria bacterium SG8_13]|nr:MAG: hypothetical protein AMJ54_16350 [Deltaproteobacteria bacterium SG8_13]